MGVAFVWGLAESTFFILVPDIWSSRVVLQNPRHGFLSCGASLAGALIGGAILFKCGRYPTVATPLLAALAHLPGINPPLIDAARIGLEQQGASALFFGLLSGIPYKLFALQAAPAGINPGLFLLVSAFARLFRFLVVTSFSWLVGYTLLNKLSSTNKLRVHAVAWTLFYLVYFWRI